MNKIGIRLFPTILIAAGLLAAGISAQAADDGGPHDKAIKARQAIMQIYGYNLGMLGAMAKGKMDYNAELATESANNLSAAVSMGQSTLWPEGSDMDNAENATNRAKMEIWSTYPEVAEKSKALDEAVVALVGSAGAGLEALKSSIGDVGKSCKGCHDDFREKEKE